MRGTPLSRRLLHSAPSTPSPAPPLPPDNKTDPGSFAVYLWDKAGTSTRLNEIPDTAQPTMTVYTVDVTIPRVPLGNYTVQAIYTTHSPVHPFFYTCSDVTILN